VVAGAERRIDSPPGRRGASPRCRRADKPVLSGWRERQGMEVAYVSTVLYSPSTLAATRLKQLHAADVTRYSQSHDVTRRGWRSPPNSVRSRVVSWPATPLPPLPRSPASPLSFSSRSFSLSTHLLPGRRTLPLGAKVGLKADAGVGCRDAGCFVRSVTCGRSGVGRHHARWVLDVVRVHDGDLVR
jgi:hypothetical protein